MLNYQYSHDQGDEDTMGFQRFVVKTTSGVRVVVEETEDGTLQQGGLHLLNDRASFFIGFPKGSKIPGFWINGDGTINLPIQKDD